MGRRIRITSATSVADGQGNRYAHGQVAEVDDELAAAWIAAGHAEPDGRTASSKGKAAKPVRQAADGRRRATRRAPRTAAKASGGTGTEAAARDAGDDGSGEDDAGSPGDA